ncbi:MAG: mannose-1-phosphate guanylyltransferase [Myxococcota bacterium]|jgi:mannose-1-phosphate guanylyltransferase/mannose-6-phosphate isomerase|nr:mannose-1-phosphate guanylyltransferase [Myxococcota bacterium]
MNRKRLHAVVLAGGVGERFWPASRAHHPKPLLEVVGGQSLLDATLERARAFAPDDNLWIVCGHEHADVMRRASGLRAGRVLVEPRRRNTAMAAAWIAQRIVAEDPDAVLVILPADHHVPSKRAFAGAIRKAAAAASREHVLVTLGVKPTRPDTGYGYIEVGPRVGRKHPGLHRVARFVEKPVLKVAKRYLSGGRHLWNAGVFIWEAATFLEEVERFAPDLHHALAPLRRKPRGRNREEVASAYRRAPSLPVDIAILERSDRVWTVPVDFAWSDVGTWDSLADELGVGTPAGRDEATRAGNRVIAGELLAIDAPSNLVWGSDRPIALLGVEDLAIVDTGDVILVTKRSRASDVKQFVAALKDRGRDDLT